MKRNDARLKEAKPKCRFGCTEILKTWQGNWQGTELEGIRETRGTTQRQNGRTREWENERIEGQANGRTEECGNVGMLECGNVGFVRGREEWKWKRVAECTS